MPRQTWLLALLLLGAAVSWAAPEASPPPGYLALEAGEVCPALDDDYQLCSENPWSGNCADFVADAGRLGEIYRAQLRAHPGWAGSLQTTIWWGCGKADLAALRALLERIGTQPARDVLAEEPYESLPRAHAPSKLPAPEQEPNCLAPATQSERDACATRSLDQAKAAYERAYSACRKRVAASQRQQLIDSETSWQQLLPVECGSAAYTGALCLTRGYVERTQSLASIHPQCAAQDSD